MKTALIVVEGTTQVSFEPENDWEQSVLEQIKKHNGALHILTGEVFECAGNYWRTIYHPSAEYARRSSLILRLDAASGAAPVSRGSP